MEMEQTLYGYIIQESSRRVTRVGENRNENIFIGHVYARISTVVYAINAPFIYTII